MDLGEVSSLSKFAQATFELSIMEDNPWKDGTISLTPRFTCDKDQDAKESCKRGVAIGFEENDRMNGVSNGISIDHESNDWMATTTIKANRKKILPKNRGVLSTALSYDLDGNMTVHQGWEMEF